MLSDEKRERGRAGERDLDAWFQANGLAYLYVNQAPEAFAPLFVGALKRPDFLVLLDSIGIIAVDAKNYTLSGGVYTLRHEEEVRRVLTFERIFRMPVWYAYRAAEGEGRVWYWISALKAIEVGEIRRNAASAEEFLAIKLEHFERIETNVDMGKLYTCRMPGLGKVKGV